MKFKFHITLILLMLSTGILLHSQNLVNAEYFINTDPGVGNGTAISITAGDTVTQSFMVNTTGLAPGEYWIFLRTQDANETWSISNARKFYVYDTAPPTLLPPSPPVTSAEYFFDDDPGAGNGNPLSLTEGDSVSLLTNISTAGLESGHHWLFVRTRDSLGVWSLTHSHQFNIFDPAAPLLPNPSAPLVAYEYFFDTDPGTGNGIQIPYTTPGDSIDWNTTISVTGLDTGWHFLYIRTMDSTNIWGIAGRNSFYIDSFSCLVPQVSFVSDSADFSNPTTFTNLSTQVNGGTTWAWDIGNDGSVEYTTQHITHTFSSAGTYFVKLTASNGFPCEASYVGQVIVGPVPDDAIAADGPLTFCSGDDVQLTAEAGNTYKWSTGETTQAITVNTSGFYYAIITNPEGFILYSDTVIVTVNQSPTLLLSSIPANTGMNNGSATVEASGGSGAYSYLWSNSQVTSTAINLLSGLYSVSVDDGVCPVSDDIIVSDSGSPSDIIAAEYFIDIDPGVGNGLSIPVSSDSVVEYIGYVDLDTLQPGWHRLYVRVMEEDSIWSIPARESFIVYDTTKTDPDTSAELVAAEYFFDTDPGPGLANPVNVIITPGDSVSRTDFLPLSGLPVGTHYAYVRFQDADGNWSIAQRDTFEIFTPVCLMPIVDFMADTVAPDSIMTFTNLTTGTDISTIYAWDIDNDGSVEYTSSDATHTFTISGFHEVKLTVFNTDTCQATIIKQVVVGSFPIAEISPPGPIDLCAGDSVILTSADSFGNVWSTGETTQSIVVKTSGIFSVTVTNIFGLTKTSPAVVVIVNPVPSAFVITFHANDNNPTGSATVFPSGGSGTYTYLWSDGQTTQTAIQLLPGNYTVTVDDGLCTTVVDAFVENVIGSPDVITYAEYFVDVDPGAGNATEVEFQFAGDQVIEIDSFSTFGLDVGYHYLFLRVQDTMDRWSISNEKKFYIYDPSPPVLEPDAPQLITAEYFFDSDPGVGNGTGISVTAGDTVMENIPVSVLGLDTGYHQIFIRTMDSDGTWSIITKAKFHIYNEDAPAPQKASPPLAGAEYFFDTDPGIGNGILFVGTGTGDSITLNTFISVAGLDTGIHHLYIRAVDSSGVFSISSRDTVYIFEPPCTVPIPDFTYVLANFGSPTVFTNLSSDVDISTTYTWDVENDGVDDYAAENIMHTFIAPGIYPVRMTADNGGVCSASIVKQVLVGPVPDTSVMITGNTTFCSGDSVVLTAASGYTYYWSTGETTQSITIKESGSYYVKVTGVMGFSLVSTPVAVTVYETPLLTTTSNPANNGGSNGSAKVIPTGGSGSYTYMWSDFQTTQTAVHLTPGIYFVTVEDGFCPVDTNITVNNNIGPLADLIAAEYFIDTDPGVGLGLPIVMSAGDPIDQTEYITTTGLDEGYHFLYVRVKDDQDAWSISRKHRFYVYKDSPDPSLPVSAPITYAEYFIDTDPGIEMGTGIAITQGDTVMESFSHVVTGLTEGPYYIYIRVKDTSDVWSIAKRKLFEVAQCGLVYSTADDGAGTLRFIMDCTNAGDTVLFDPVVFSDTIKLTSAELVFDKNLTIIASLTDHVLVKGSTTDRVFNILPGNQVYIEGLHLFSGSALDGGSIVNQGNLTLKNVRLYQRSQSPEGKNILYNINSLTIQGNTKVLED